MAWPDGGRRLAVEAAAPGHLDLQLDQVEPGGQLGHRVLDLEAGVHLHEVEAPGLGRVQELDRAGVGVPAPGGTARPPPA